MMKAANAKEVDMHGDLHTALAVNNELLHAVLQRRLDNPRIRPSALAVLRFDDELARRTQKPKPSYRGSGTRAS